MSSSWSDITRAAVPGPDVGAKLERLCHGYGDLNGKALAPALLLVAAIMGKTMTEYAPAGSPVVDKGSSVDADGGKCAEGGDGALELVCMA